MDDKQPILPIIVQPLVLYGGERVISSIISADGSRRYWLILLPGEAEPADWQTQMKWATEIGGRLPDHVESALLFACMKSEFRPEGYWTHDQHATNSDWAWCQSFFGGGQDYYYKHVALPARAVRRIEWNTND